MTTPIIRNALVAEYEEVARVTADSYREYAASISTEMWAEYEKDLRGVAERATEAEIIVAELEKEIVGAVAYYPPRDEAHMFPAGWGAIRVLAVLPTHRGSGIGRLLTNECITRAELDGAEQLGLYTTQLMMIAKGMYERMGFELVNEFDAGDFKYWSYAMPLRRA